MLARDVRAAAYHCRALEASELAAASILDRVREKHEVAAARWRVLAAMDERAELVSAPPSDVADPKVGTAVGADSREEIPCIT